MRVIGLTGGIACGKSTISAALREMGAVIIDGDVLSRELTVPGGPALPAIREQFGDGVFLPDGVLDRRALGAVVFGSDQARECLDGIMQPMLRRMILEGIENARASGAALCVLDMPLLYEAGLDVLCDRVWCAWIPRETQIARLMARDGFTCDEAEARLRSQLPAEQKAARADVVIDTSGAIQYTMDRLPTLFQEELRQDV
ncbi:MAG: dephospho-CoA kinase [Christensenellaceae bacterium]|nr:dephospho-CoA kinase [Christensenellaceae bacterium]